MEADIQCRAESGKRECACQDPARPPRWIALDRQDTDAASLERIRAYEQTLDDHDRVVVWAESPGADADSALLEFPRPRPHVRMLAHAEDGVKELRAALSDACPRDVILFLGPSARIAPSEITRFAVHVGSGEVVVGACPTDSESTDHAPCVVGLRREDLSSILPFVLGAGSNIGSEVQRVAQEQGLQTRCIDVDTERMRSGWPSPRAVLKRIIAFRASLRAGRRTERARLPRRVLALSWRCPWHPEAGGAEVMLMEHLRRWSANGHEVTLFSAHFPGAAREETRDGIRIVRRGGRFSVYAWAAVLYVLKLRWSADAVLDVENGIPFFTPLYVRKPVICLVHHVHRDQFLWEFGPVLGRVGRFLECNLMPAIYRHTPFIAVSRSTREELASIGVDGERIGIVHNGLDHSAYRRFVQRSRKPRLAYVGRLKRHKRVDLLIDLCARLRDVAPELVLDIVGVGDDEDRLRRMVQDRGLQDMVQFHGFVSHSRKVAIYSQAWAVLMASEREGWGLCVVEAAACGTPALCLDAPGLRDAVQHGVSGWLAQDMDEAFSVATRLLTDPAWRDALAEGALERSREFTWDASASAGIDALVHAWLDHRKKPRRAEVPATTEVALVLRRSDIPVFAWPDVAEALKPHIRSGDTARSCDDGIELSLALKRETDIGSVGRRIDSVLDHFSRVAWPHPAPSHHERDQQVCVQHQGNAPGTVTDLLHARA